MPPLADAQAPRDLWPQMLIKLDQRDRRVSWFDWGLVVMLMIWLFLFPEAVAVLLYQL
jgi:hypothetical protein